jgi:2-oxoglutarate dehydrogenase E2 component (dihydrolipoamide succinyltransferase)
MSIVEVKVPQLSESVAEATLLQWKKKVGDAGAMDEILIEVETDKVVLEVPAPAGGVLVELVMGDGATVAAEQLIARIDTEAKAGASAPAALVAAAPPAASAIAAPAAASHGGCRHACGRQADGRQQPVCRFGGRYWQGWPRHQGRRAGRHGSSYASCY